MATPWINEIHYDNTGADAQEAIEVGGLAGTSLSGFELVLYNGANGQPYATVALTGTIPAQQDGYGTLNFAHSGIQNGPDAVALINPSGTVLQFLSYEGTFAAASGAASPLLFLSLKSTRYSCGVSSAQQTAPFTPAE